MALGKSQKKFYVPATRRGGGGKGPGHQQKEPFLTLLAKSLFLEKFVAIFGKKNMALLVQKFCREFLLASICFRLF